MEYKIAMIGAPSTILGFQALGASPFPIQSVEEGDAALKKIHQSKEFAVVFITEDWAEQLSESLTIFEGMALPAVVTIPSHEGSTGAGLKNISRIVEKAVGSDILSKS